MKSGFETKAGSEAADGKRAFVPPPVEEIAKLFPQLEIVELLGQGGMGAVYKARQPRLNRFVALKILSPERQRDPQFAERFEREARALAWLNQPNIVTVYDFGEVPGIYYLLMEFVDGLSLRQLLRQRRLASGEALAIVVQICQALQYAHDQGVIHRDIKPENILLDKKGQVKIADFGIAKLLEQEPHDISLTGASEVVGTPHYMAPEQIEKPQTVDQRADIYSLGVVFYEMLTGELPLGNFQPPSQKVQIDVRLDQVVLHALEKEPERRFQAASEVKTAVETIASSTPPPLDAAGIRPPYWEEDYTLEIGSCLRRGWALVWSDFWPILGVTLLILCLRVAALSTGIGLVISGPLMGGLWFYFLKRIRGEPAVVGTAFCGLGRAFLPLFLASILMGVFTLLGFICLVLPGLYLVVGWSFTLVLIVDKQLGFWPAMGLSRTMISRHWWKFFGFIIVLSLLNSIGMMLFMVGCLVTVPVTLAAMMFAYEDIFGERRPTLIPPLVASVTTAPPSKKIMAWFFAGLLILLGVFLFFGVELNQRRHVLPNEIGTIASDAGTHSNPEPATVPIVEQTAEQPSGQAPVDTNSSPASNGVPRTFSELSIQSAVFGVGIHVIDMTERVKELLNDQPEGVIINAHAMGADPLSGRVKVLTVDFKYQGRTFATVVPERAKLSYEFLLDHRNQIFSPSTASRTQNDGVDSNGFEAALNADQRIASNYINLKFARFTDERNFDGWSAGDRSSLESRMLDSLNGPQSDDCNQAINTLAALHSTNALPHLRKLAFEHRDTLVKLEKSNRPRWMAIRALGVMGDKPAVPARIHLLYHNNSYVRWSAQIALVRLTGQNFGGDWRAWGKWVSAQRAYPPFNPEVVRWWRGQAEPDELAKELAEADRRFLDNIRGVKHEGTAPSALIKSLSE